MLGVWCGGMDGPLPGDGRGQPGRTRPGEHLQAYGRLSQMIEPSCQRVSICVSFVLFVLLLLLLFLFYFLFVFFSCIHSPRSRPT